MEKLKLVKKIFEWTGAISGLVSGALSIIICATNKDTIIFKSHGENKEITYE